MPYTSVRGADIALPARGPTGDITPEARQARDQSLASAASAEADRLASQDAANAAASAAGTVGNYDTLAQANAALSSIPANGGVNVMADGANNGFYVKVGTALVRKSTATLPALDAKNLQLTASVLPQRASVGMLTDVGGWKDVYTSDGKNVVAGVDYDNVFRAIMLDAPGAPALTDDLLYAIVTGSGSLVFGIDHDGRMVSAGSPIDMDVFARFVSGNSRVYAVARGSIVPITFGEADAFGPRVEGSSILFFEDADNIVTAKGEDVSARTSLSAERTGVSHFLLYGQSLSDGSFSTPVQTVLPVAAGRVVTFNVGPRTRGGADANSPTDSANLLSLVDAREVNAETPASQIGLEVAVGLPPAQGILLSAHGRGGTSYSGLRSGTGPYENILRAVRRARIIAGLNGHSYDVPAMSFIHGENNLSDSAQVYQSYIEELQADVSTDVAIYTGDSREVVLAVDQLSNWTKYGAQPRRSDVPLAQLRAGLANENRIICVGPKYMLPTSADGIHLTAPSSAWLGAYHGRALRRHLGGMPWKPTYVTSAVRSGSSVVLTFSTPDGEVVIDPVSVSDPGNFGVEFIQSGGNAVSVTSVVKTAPQQITVTLSAVPTGADQAIGIARTGIPGQDGGPSSGARSCIRDSSSDVSAAGMPLFNWACHQEISITAEG